MPAGARVLAAADAEGADHALDREAGGGAGGREERAVVQRVAGPGPGPPFAGGQQAGQPDQLVAQARQLVERLLGVLADHVDQHPEQGAEHQPEQHVREQQALGVGQQGVDGAGLVDPVRVGGAAVDLAALTAGRLGVPQHRVGGDHDPVAGGVDPPAEVGVVPHQREGLVEAAELLEDVPADQHARGGDGEHRTDLVVLALVLLAAVQAGPTAAGAGDGDAHFEQLAAVVPAAQLGSDHGGGRSGVGDLEQPAQGVGLRLAVVVQQPEPLDRLGLPRAAAAELVLGAQRVAEVVPTARHRVVPGGVEAVREVLGAQRRGVEDGLAHGVAEAGAAAEDQRTALRQPVAEGVPEQLGGGVGGAGVDGEDALDRTVLPEQAGQGLREPPGTVVGDDHGGDQVARVCGRPGSGEAALVAVDGHRVREPQASRCGQGSWRTTLTAPGGGLVPGVPPSTCGSGGKGMA
ncbi:hypothetical protein GCM10020229_36810 [Kitasatospora albolonga]